MRHPILEFDAFQHTLSGLDMPTVSEMQRVFVQAGSGTYRLLVADDHIDATTARTTVVTLANTPASGDRWTLSLTLNVADTAGNLLLAAVPVAGQPWSVRIDGSDAMRYEVTVGGAIDTVAEIAAAFALAINDDADAAAFTANAAGGQLTLAKAGGGSFGVEFGVGYTYNVLAGNSRAVIAGALTSAVNTAEGAALRAPHATTMRTLKAHVPRTATTTIRWDRHLRRLSLACVGLDMLTTALPGVRRTGWWLAWRPSQSLQ